MNNYLNLLFIDENVMDYNIFIESTNQYTYSIVYNNYTYTELLNIINQYFTSIQRIGIVNYKESLFLNNEPLFLDYSFNDNSYFLRDLINDFKVEHIDFLACNTLTEPKWVNYLNFYKRIQML